LQSDAGSDIVFLATMNTLPYDCEEKVKATDSIRVYSVHELRVAFREARTYACDGYYCYYQRAVTQHDLMNPRVDKMSSATIRKLLPKRPSL